MATAILYTVDKVTRNHTREVLPENQIRKMKRSERVFDFMITGRESHHDWMKSDIEDGLAVYRIIE